MAYRLKAGESVPEGLKRVAREELESAAAGLEHTSAAKRDEAIHEARKSLKKTRAILRMVRDELDDVYARENRRLRDTGQRLSGFRDAGVIIETFDGLRQKYAGDLKGNSLGGIRLRLLASKRENERRTPIVATLKEIAATIRTAGNQIGKWPLHVDGFEAIAPGLENTFRAGRDAMDRARRKDRPEDYHEWRKRTKDHWYHIRLLESLWTEMMEAYETSLKDLETWLGEDHNLVILHDRLQAQPDGYGSKQNVDLCLGLIARYQKELRKNSLSLGERIYEEKPSLFTRRMEHLWDAWQDQPKTLQEAQRAAHAGM